MTFSEWLKIHEVGTGTNAVAVFSRPIFGEPVRRATHDEFILGGRRKGKRRHDWEGTVVEGKALEITSDMSVFANETANRLRELSMGGGWEYDTVAYERDVDGGKYGRKHVQIILWKGRSGVLAEAGDDKIWVKFDDNYKWSSSVIEHELVHIFDPKLQGHLHDASWSVQKQPEFSDGDDTEKYFASPWEQDAYMSQFARKRIYDLYWQSGEDMNAVEQAIKNYKPNNSVESFWAKNPKMWQKYLKTMFFYVQGLRKHT